MTINGVSKTGYANATVAEMLQREGYKISQVAIELNEQILPKGQYEDTVLKEDDVIEVVSFIGRRLLGKEAYYNERRQTDPWRT